MNKKVNKKAIKMLIMMLAVVMALALFTSCDEKESDKLYFKAEVVSKKGNKVTVRPIENDENDDFVVKFDIQNKNFTPDAGDVITLRCNGYKHKKKYAKVTLLSWDYLHSDEIFDDDTWFDKSFATRISGYDTTFFGKITDIYSNCFFVEIYGEGRTDVLSDYELKQYYCNYCGYEAKINYELSDEFCIGQIVSFTFTECFFGNFQMEGELLSDPYVIPIFSENYIDDYYLIE